MQHPLNFRELIPNDTLRRLGQIKPAGGALTPEDHAELVMILPDLCAELLMWRLLADTAQTSTPITRRHLATNIAE